MDNAYQHSTIAQILENILEQYTFEGESKSNIADILLSILNKTEYNEDPHSVIGDLLIRLKAKIEGESYDPYGAAYTSRIAEILISILEETEYTEEPQSRIAELLLQLKEELEAYTELTASGSVASFITNVVKPLVNGEFTIEAYQEGSGDPSPVNVRNIVPRREVNIYQRGINLWDEQWRNGYYSNIGEFNPNNNNIANKNPIIVTPNTEYYIRSSDNYPWRIFYFDKNDNFISLYGVRDGAFTTPSNCAYINFCTANTTYGGTYKNDVSINYPSSDTSYHAYNGNDYLVNLGEDTYGAVYNSVTGGKVKNKFGFVADNNLIVSKTGSSGGLSTFMIKYAINNFPQPQSLTFISSHFSRSIPSGNSGRMAQAQNEVYLIIDNSLLSEDTESGFVEWLVNNNVTFSYTLAEPIDETPISPTPINTFNGDNNIFCDTGDTSVTYLYKGTPPVALGAKSSKPLEFNELNWFHELNEGKDDFINQNLDELQDLDISDKEVK